MADQGQRKGKEGMNTREEVASNGKPMLGATHSSGVVRPGAEATLPAPQAATALEGAREKGLMRSSMS